MSCILIHRVRPGLALASAIVAVVMLAAAPVGAQQEIHLFPCKIVCGYQLGNVRLLNDTSPLNEKYEDLKPGNYATTCNMFNYDIDAPTQPVFTYVAVEGAPLIFLTQLNVASLTANSFGCVDLINNLPPPPPNGVVFEGYLNFFTFDPDFRFDGVRTFESQNAFERHVMWFYDSFGLFGVASQTLGLGLGAITSPLALLDEELRSEFATASGAGGLGLGASIDVEDVDRITIDLSSPGDPDKMPVEVRNALDQAGPGG